MNGHVLCFDAGANVGWALLYSNGRDVSWIDGGVMRHDDPTLRDLVGKETRADTVVIETPSGYAFEAKRVAGLLHANLIAGIIVGVAEWTAHRVVMTTAGEVRKALCCRANATDAMVKDAVSRVVQNMPKRSSNHMRDAVAAGWWHIRTMQLVDREWRRSGA